MRGKLIEYARRCAEASSEYIPTDDLVRAALTDILGRPPTRADLRAWRAAYEAAGGVG